MAAWVGTVDDDAILVLLTEAIVSESALDGEVLLVVEGWLACVEAGGAGGSLVLFSVEAIVAVGVEDWLTCVRGGDSLVLLSLEAVVAVGVVESIATMVLTTDDERTDAIV